MSRAADDNLPVVTRSVSEDEIQNHAAHGVPPLRVGLRHRKPMTDHSTETYYRTRPAIFRWDSIWDGQTRFKFFLTCCVFPFGMIAVLLVPRIRDSTDLAGLLLRPVPSLGFLPLFLFSFVALGTGCIKPKTISKPWVRLGIYSGLFLCLQHFAIFLTLSYRLVPAFAVVSFLLAGGLAILCEVVSWYVPKKPQFRISHLLIATAIAAFVSLTVVPFLRPWRNFGISLALVIVAGTPCLTSFNFYRAARDCWQYGLGKTGEKISMGALMSWLICWIGAWAFALSYALTKFYELNIPGGP